MCESRCSEELWSLVLRNDSGITDLVCDALHVEQT